MNTKINLFTFQLGVLVLLVFSCKGVMEKSTVKETKRSTAFSRYKNGNLQFEQQSSFFTNFKYYETTGLGYNTDPLQDTVIQEKLAAYKRDPRGPYEQFRVSRRHPELQIAYHLRNSLKGFEASTTFRDPTSPIKIGNLYHVWYTKTWGGGPVGQEQGSQGSYRDTKGNWKRIYSWDIATIWHATSKDGYHWEEEGMALEPGPTGSFDDRCVFTPDILVANGKYYMYYQVAKSPHVYKEGPHHIAMAWADSPNGPWYKHDKLILSPTGKGGFDSRKVHDPSLIKKGGKYWLYYKGDGDHSDRSQFGEFYAIGWGVAVSDKPEGPFVRSELNPVVTGGHEVVIFPYKSGVSALVRQGPELFSLQYAADGLNFELASHLKNVPRAGAFYRQGNFKDIDLFPAKFPKWGLSHENRLLSKEAHIVHFDVFFKEKK